MSYLWSKLLSILNTLGEKIKHVIDNSNSIMLAVVLIVILILILKRVSNFNRDSSEYSISTTSDDETIHSENNFQAAIHTFRKENLVSLRDFYLYPEGLKQFEDIDWRNIYRVFRSLIKTDESLRRYYGNQVTVLPKDTSRDLDGMMVLVNKVNIVSNEITQIDLTIKNISNTEQKLNMGTTLQSLRKNETFTMIINHANSLTLEHAENIHSLKNGTIQPNEEVHITIYFRTIERSYIKNLTHIEIRLKLKYSAKGKPTEFVIPFEVGMNDFPDSITQFKQELDINATQYFLSCGGFVTVAVLISLAAFFMSMLIILALGMFGIFALWFLALPLIVVLFTIPFVIYGLNINSKFHQIIQDLVRQNELNQSSITNQ